MKDLAEAGEGNDVDLTVADCVDFNNQQEANRKGPPHKVWMI